MRLKTLSVKNFRTHKEYVIKFNRSVTLITGLNGSGKTSLLEAIYIALRGKSFKGTDEMIRQYGTEWYRIDLDTDMDLRIVKHQVVGTKKTFEIDSKIHYRLNDRTKYPVVLFEPDDLRIISGSPTRRRDYLDTLVSQYDPHYTTALRRYERALLQRNKLLKQPHHTNDELFAWNVSLSQYGAIIITARQDAITYINKTITSTYQTISPINDEIRISYSQPSSLSSNQLLAELEQSYARDIMNGITSIGPHRHDMVVELNGGIASEVGSRGELRTITLALKFIEATLIIERTGVQPIIILDDVFSELDTIRQHRLLSEFLNNQVIMTSVDAIDTIPSVRLS